MNAGGRVYANGPLGCAQMFYGRDELPRELTLPAGAPATVESAWKSGGGIVKFDGGPRVMVLDLAARFTHCEGGAPLCACGTNV